MSAFVVDNVVIDRILAGCRIMLNEGCHLPSPAFVGSFQMVGQRLLTMNNEAYNQRYQETAPAPEYVYSPAPEGNTMLSSFKAAECLLYQCSEGNVPETPLFKALQELANQMACFIVRRTPGYDLAKGWDN